MLIKRVFHLVVNNMYECFHCGLKAVVWDNDFSFEDCLYEGEGIVHMCHCCNCGADIEYRIPLDEEKEKLNEQES